jgi:hypothetical protein
MTDQLRRKGIPLPSVKECKAAKAKAIEWNETYPDFAFSILSPGEKCESKKSMVEILSFTFWQAFCADNLSKAGWSWGCCLSD